jgi:hypothetical protein
MKSTTIFILAVLALGIFSISATAEDMENLSVIGMVIEYNAGSSIIVNDEYTGAKNTFSIAGDALVDGEITAGSYVEIETLGNEAIYIGVITLEKDE